jgi:hypothetical protein
LTSRALEKKQETSIKRREKKKWRIGKREREIAHKTHTHGACKETHT